MTLIENLENRGVSNGTKAELFLFTEQSRYTIDGSDGEKNVLLRGPNGLFLADEIHDGFVAEEKVNPIFYSRTEMPLKGDKILVEQFDGTYSIQVAHKNLSNRDLYVESTRMVFKILASHEDLSSEQLNKIIKEDWTEDKTYFIESEDKIYNKRNLKEVDYMFYDSNDSIYKLKKPLQIRVF
jgi:hypothetical protein